MTKGEIQEQITKEIRHIEAVKRKIAEFKFDITATKKALTMWKSMLKKANKRSRRK